GAYRIKKIAAHSAQRSQPASFASVHITLAKKRARHVGVAHVRARRVPSARSHAGEGKANPARYQTIGLNGASCAVPTERVVWRLCAARTLLVACALALCDFAHCDVGLCKGNLVLASALGALPYPGFFGSIAFSLSKCT